MDNGRRSFLQGRSLLSNVIAGYADANRESNTSVLASATLLSNNSITFSETDTANLIYQGTEYKLWEPPKYIGYWEITPAPASFRISTTYKPNWLHRKMAKLFFGWAWIEGKLF